MAAFSLDEGIVSPGGVGYDINCLAGDTKITLADGSKVKIADLEKNFQEVGCGNGLVLLQKIKSLKVRTLDGEGEAVYLMKGRNKTFRLKTAKNFEINATEDHPFLTEEGMKPLGKLCVGDSVAVYAKAGIAFDKIVEITACGESEVYDITVEKDHNFVANGFIVSNCGVRLLRTDLRAEDVKPRAKELVQTLFANIPSGVGSKSKIRLDAKQLGEAVTQGAAWAVEKGYGVPDDIEHCEENGCMKGADFSKASDMAKKRGAPQFGTLGSGNHFIEIQRVERILDADIAKAFGITSEGQVTVMIHSGSRGYGHQVCDDYIRVMLGAAQKYKIQLPDKELCCAPLSSDEARDYLGAMNSAVNYAFCNRQVMTHGVRETFARVFGKPWETMGMQLVYDVCHNIAKMEEHGGKKVCVHRKGATRAFWKGREEIPAAYRSIGQPVIIPGSMNTASYLLCGLEGAAETWGSTCHGAGRTMSRHEALRAFRGIDVQKKMEADGIAVKAMEPQILAEEAGGAYKDVDAVVRSVEKAGLCKIVARFVPMGVIKG